VTGGAKPVKMDASPSQSTSQNNESKQENWQRWKYDLQFEELHQVFRVVVLSAVRGSLSAFGSCQIRNLAYKFE
jgi:hypothetical protein